MVTVPTVVRVTVCLVGPAVAAVSRLVSTSITVLLEESALHPTRASARTALQNQIARKKSSARPTAVAMEYASIRKRVYVWRALLEQRATSLSVLEDAPVKENVSVPASVNAKQGGQV